MHRIALAVTLFATFTAGASDLRGVVVDASAQPIAGAHVYVYTAHPRIGVSAFCPSCYRDCGKHVPVDAKGAFQIEELDPKLVFDVLAVADGYESAFAYRIDPGSGGAVKIELRPRSLADSDRLIIGTVVDQEGKPVIGAVVEPSGYREEVRRPDGTMTARTGYGKIPGLEQLSITDAKGEFALRIPDAKGKLDVRVIARAAAPHIDRLLVPGRSRTIRMTDGATISGHVLRDGKPVAGTRVSFVQRNRASSGYLGRSEIATDDDGRFVMTNLGPNEAWVVFTPLENEARAIVEPVVVEVGPDGTSVDNVELNIVRGRRVAGKVTLPDGVALPPKTQITLSNDLAGDGRSVEVRADGTFAFESAPAGITKLGMRIPGVRLSYRSPRFLSQEFAVGVPEQGDVTDIQMIFECADDGPRRP